MRVIGIIRMQTDAFALRWVWITSSQRNDARVVAAIAPPPPPPPAPACKPARCSSDRSNDWRRIWFRLRFSTAIIFTWVQLQAQRVALVKLYKDERQVAAARSIARSQLNLWPKAAEGAAKGAPRSWSFAAESSSGSPHMRVTSIQA